MKGLEYTDCAKLSPGVAVLTVQEQDQLHSRLGSDNSGRGVPRSYHILSYLHHRDLGSTSIFAETCFLLSPAFTMILRLPIQSRTAKTCKYPDRALPLSIYNSASLLLRSPYPHTISPKIGMHLVRLVGPLWSHSPVHKRIGLSLYTGC